MITNDDYTDPPLPELPTSNGPPMIFEYSPDTGSRTIKERVLMEIKEKQNSPLSTKQNLPQKNHQNNDDEKQWLHCTFPLETPMPDALPQPPSTPLKQKVDLQKNNK